MLTPEPKQTVPPELQSAAAVCRLAPAARYLTSSPVTSMVVISLDCTYHGGLGGSIYQLGRRAV